MTRNKEQRPVTKDDVDRTMVVASFVNALAANGFQKMKVKDGSDVVKFEGMSGSLKALRKVMRECEFVKYNGAFPCAEPRFNSDDRFVYYFASKKRWGYKDSQRLVGTLNPMDGELEFFVEA